MKSKNEKYQIKKYNKVLTCSSSSKLLFSCDADLPAESITSAAADERAGGGTPGAAGTIIPGAGGMAPVSRLDDAVKSLLLSLLPLLWFLTLPFPGSGGGGTGLGGSVIFARKKK